MVEPRSLSGPAAGHPSCHVIASYINALPGNFKGERTRYEVTGTLKLSLALCHLQATQHDHADESSD